jgi:glycerol-3-phosphate dehydrogenase subunit B
LTASPPGPIDPAPPVEQAAPGAQAAYDVIIVGAGLAGLFAGVLAAARGNRVLVIARGLGGLQLGTGSIDVWGYRPDGNVAENPVAEAENAAGEHHPLRLAGFDVLRSALDEFRALCSEAGYVMQGSADHNHFLPTAIGAVRPTCLAPQSFTSGELRHVNSELVLGELPGFRDFFADFAAANLNATGYRARAISLEMPRMPARRDAFATDLARLLDGERYRADLARLWRPWLAGVKRLGLPAIIGLRHATAAWQDLGERLDTVLFEIPVLPPSVPGIRLHNLLQRVFEAAGGRMITGPGVTGWVESDGTPAARARGVIANTAGGARYYAAEVVVLATGGFRHGGLLAPAAGQIRESVFDLPAAAGNGWYDPIYWAAQPYARFGLRVNSQMQVLDASGGAVYDNVLAVGGLLAGADRNSEASREGIDLATAYKAAQTIGTRHNQ